MYFEGVAALLFLISSFNSTGIIIPLSFSISEKTCDEYDLENVTLPLIGRSSHAHGIFFTDEDWEKKTAYVYDVVEKVPVPVTIDNIVKTAAMEKFGKEITSYVAANIYKSNDETVKSYTEFAKNISEQAEKMGYK